MSARSQYVVARSYGHGAWMQFSGRDLSAHLGRVSDYWEKSFPDKKEGTVLFLGRNTYGSFVTGLGISLAGLNVMFMPAQASEHDISWCVKYFNCFAIA